MNDCSGGKVSPDEDPIDEIRNKCGFDNECSDEEREDIGDDIADAYINPNPICQPTDIVEDDQGEIYLENQRDEAKKRKLDDGEGDDQDYYRDRMTPEDLQTMRRYQWHLLPVDFIAKYAMYLEYLFNPDDPERSTLRCPICYENHEKYFLKAHMMSAFARENGTLKDTLFDNLAAIKKHRHSKSHQVCESELKWEKKFRLRKELGKFANEEYRYVITNRHMRMVYNGKFSKLSLSTLEFLYS